MGKRGTSSTMSKSPFPWRFRPGGFILKSPPTLGSILGRRMSAKVDRPQNLVYPAPRLPMVGKYLVRKRYVASGLRAIDLACSLLAKPDPMSLSDKGEKLRSIVFAQCGHFGDLIMTLPTLRWVRQNQPEMRIGLIVGSWAKPMMSGISALYDACYFADHFMLNRSNWPLKEKLTQHWQSWMTAASQIR